MLRRIWILSAKRGGEECAINVAFIQVMPFTMDIVRKHLRLYLLPQGMVDGRGRLCCVE